MTGVCVYAVCVCVRVAPPGRTTDREGGRLGPVSRRFPVAGAPLGGLAPSRVRPRSSPFHGDPSGGVAMAPPAGGVR